MPYRDLEKRKAHNRAYLAKWKAAHPDYQKQWYAKNKTRLKDIRLQKALEKIKNEQPKETTNV